MSPFELVFALFGLLLGLAIAEVLGGFARVLKLKRLGRTDVRVGWLTPLLGLLVILDQTGSWLIAWNLRDLIPANGLTLVLVLAIVGTYYLASTLIFPDDPAAWPDFDAHYDRQNRFVLGAQLFANLSVLVLAFVLAATGAHLPGMEAHRIVQHSAFAEVIGWASFFSFLLLIALIVIKSRRVNIALLSLLIAINLAGAVVSAVG